MAKLWVLLKLKNDKEENLKSWFLQNGKKYVVGRGKESDLRIKHFSISKKHCEILVKKNGKVKVTDLESANGTLIGKHQEILKPGEMVKLKLSSHLTLGSCTDGLHFSKLLENEEYKSSWVKNGRIEEEGVILPDGVGIEEQNSEREKTEKKKGELRSRSRSKSKEKYISKVSKDFEPKSSKEGSFQTTDGSKERENIQKWLLSSSDMSPESQRKFLMMMGVKPDAISRNYDLIKAEKEVQKFKI